MSDMVFGLLFAETRDKEFLLVHMKPKIVCVFIGGQTPMISGLQLRKTVFYKISERTFIMLKLKDSIFTYNHKENEE